MYMCKEKGSEGGVCMYELIDRELRLRSAVMWFEKINSGARKKTTTSQHVHKGRGKDGTVCSGVLTFP